MAAVVVRNEAGLDGGRVRSEPIPIGGRLGPILGWVCLCHFVLQVVIKVFQGRPEHVLWVCHIGLLVAGLGLVFRSRLLIATALVQLFVLHALWLIDLAIWKSLGFFPMGVVDYLDGADVWTWVGTSYHFYCVPVLSVTAWRWKVYDRAALLLALTLSLSLIVLSRALVSPEVNVNWAYGIEASRPIYALSAFNALPSHVYVLVLGVFGACVLFAPVFWLLRCRACRGCVGGA